MNDFNEDDFLVENIIFDALKDLKITLQIHKANSQAVLIIYPGADGSIDGYNKKYRRLAQLIRSKNIATVIQLDNKYYPSDNSTYSDLMIDKIAQIIQYVDDNSKKITGHNEIDFYLAGISAGAGAIATVLGEFPRIKKALFIAPAENVGLENIAKGLEHYEGELYLTAGEDDEIETFKSAKTYYDLCQKTSRKELVLIPECNHRFTGEKNGRIMANAFLWAFSEKSNFPNPESGIFLYK